MRALARGETVILRRVDTVKDEDGNPLRNDYGEIITADVDIPVKGCAVYPAGTMGQAFAFENLGGQPSMQSIRYVVYMPAHTQVDANDKVLYRGILFDAEGEPGYSHSPFSGTEGPITLYLKRVTG